MEEILHHLECRNLVNHGVNYLPTGAGFLPSTVSTCINSLKHPIFSEGHGAFICSLHLEITPPSWVGILANSCCSCKFRAAGENTWSYIYIYISPINGRSTWWVPGITTLLIGVATPCVDNSFTCPSCGFGGGVVQNTNLNSWLPWFYPTISRYEGL